MSWLSRTNCFVGSAPLKCKRSVDRNLWTGMDFNTEFDLTHHTWPNYYERLAAYDRGLKPFPDEKSFVFEKTYSFLLRMFGFVNWKPKDSSECLRYFEPETSAGFCPDLWDCSLKKDWIETCYPEVYNTYVDELMRGARYPILKCALKEEVLPVENGKVKKSRLFIFTDAAMTLFTSCFTKDMDEQLFAHHMQENWFGAGLNIYHKNWDSFVRYVYALENKIVRDARQFDSSHIQELIMVCKRLRIDLCDVEFRSKMVKFLTVIYENMGYSFILGVDGRIYWKNDGTGSGKYTTLSDNTIISIFIIIYCIVKKYPDISYEGMIKTNHFTTCGDDVAGSSSIIGSVDLVENAKDLGIEYTGDKGDKDPLESYDFISCNSYLYEGKYYPVISNERGLVSSYYTSRPQDAKHTLQRIAGICLGNMFNKKLYETCKMHFSKIVNKFDPLLYDDVDYMQYRKNCINVFEKGFSLYGDCPNIYLQGSREASQRLESPRIKNIEIFNKNCACEMSTRRYNNNNNNNNRRGGNSNEPAWVKKIVGAIQSEMQKDTNRGLIGPQRRGAQRYAPQRFVGPQRRDAPRYNAGNRNQRHRNSTTDAAIERVISQKLAAMNLSMKVQPKPTKQVAPSSSYTRNTTSSSNNWIMDTIGNDERVCVQNYARLLVNPFVIPSGPWCNIAANPAKTTRWTSVFRADFKADANGEFWCTINPYSLANDAYFCLYTDGSVPIAGTINTGMGPGSVGGLGTNLGYTGAQLTWTGLNSSPIRGRVVAAGICVSPTGNATVTAGSIYGFTTQGARPNDKFPATTITSSITSPRMSLNKDGCYTHTFVPQDPIQNNFLSANPADIIGASQNIFVASSVVNEGGVIFVYGNGLTGGYPMHADFVIHAEYEDNSIFPTLAKQSVQNPKLGAIIQQVASDTNTKHIETKPERGLWDRFVDGVKDLGNAIAEPLGKFIGTGVKALML